VYNKTAGDFVRLCDKKIRIDVGHILNAYGVMGVFLIRVNALP
jgi:hypothetical protein